MRYRSYGDDDRVAETDFHCRSVSTFLVVAFGSDATIRASSVHSHHRYKKLNGKCCSNAVAPALIWVSWKV